MFKRVSLLFGLAAFLTAGDARAFFYTVTGTADNTDAVTHGGSGTAVSPFQMSSLRGAVLHANANAGPHTITLPAGNYLLTIPGNITTAGTGEGYTGNASIGDLDITANNTTIQGAGAASTTIRQTTPTLPTASNDRVLEVNPGLLANFNFTLQDVTVSGGRTPDGGGGIVCGSSNNVTILRHCTFTNNVAFGASSAGGAVDCLGGGTLIADACTFTNNSTVTDSGGAIDFFANPYAGSLNVTNSVFCNNSSGANGGAIDVAGTLTGTSIITGCTFLTNSAANQGGAIAVPASGALSINLNRFFANTAATPANGMALTRSGLSTLNSSNNWWGFSTGPAANDVIGTSVGTWLQLTHYASPAAINLGGAATLFASFTTNSAGVQIPLSSLGVLIGLPITFANPVLGAISSPQATIQASGTATATFTAGSIPGAASADAIVDAGTNTAPITILCPSLGGTIGGGGTICPGAATNVSVSITGGTPPYTVTLDHGGGTQAGSSPLVLTVSPAATTIYSVVSATDTYGCPASVSGSATVTVFSIPPPTIAPVPANVCTNSAGNQASAPSGYTSYAWTISNGTITSATNASAITYTAGTAGSVTLSVTVTTAGGCSASATTNVTIVSPPTPVIIAGGCSFRTNYFSSLTFTDNPMQYAVMTLAFDGTNYWCAHGGSSGVTNYARYDAAGNLLATYQPGLDFRSVFTDASGQVFARAFGDATIYRQVAPGSFVSSGVALTGGSLNSQSSVVLNGVGTEYIAMFSGVVSRWSTNGATLGAVNLTGFGTLTGESGSPQNRGIAAVGGFWLTYSGSGVLSVWDSAGNRVMTATLLGAGTSSDSAYSFGYCNGQVFIVDNLGGSWRGYEVCSGERTAIFAAESNDAWNADVQNKIAGAAPALQTGVFRVDGTNSVPTLASLRRYSSVLVYSDSPGFSDSTSLGNALADYVDQGGGVVVATFAFYSSGGLSLQGRLVTGGYLPFTTGTQSSSNGMTLVADLPAHPLLANVSSFNGGTSSYHHSPISTTAGAALVAHWSNGQPLVGAKDVSAGRTVGLNFFPPSSDVRSDFWVAGTDGARLMANALLWAGKTPPIIVTNPVNQVGPVGSFVTFSVAAVGTGPLSYQWRQDGIALPGATTNAITVEVQPANVGNYRCVVSNAYGVAFSTSAALGAQLRFLTPSAPAGGLLPLLLESSDHYPLPADRVPRIRVYASTNAALPFGGWSPLSNTLTLSNGLLRVEGVSGTAPPARFFRAVETP